ncbi:DNA cytosine methyltransferase [Photobacterium damselae subsp. damselae]
MNHIELFAGCGGLSLGLDQAGFELTLANELSPMAAESFVYNFFDENLECLAKEQHKHVNAIWLNSKYPDLKARLRENPFQFPSYGEDGYSDLPDNFDELKGKLIVGSIVDLNRLLDDKPELVQLLQNGFGESGLDLVSGGPPCQSFSMAGLRKRDCEKNTLPWEFAKFVKHTQPRIALLENVTGILRPFKDDEGNEFHAWYEVAKVFASYGYVPLCLHINARLVGIAQNRPRFIMIAVRNNHLKNIYSLLDDNSQKLFEEPLRFFDIVQKANGDAQSVSFGHLSFIDAIKNNSIFMNSLLKPLVDGKLVSVRDAIDDLKKGNPSKPSPFIDKLNQTFALLSKREKLSNHDFRQNSDIVRRRFRIYQILQELNDRNIVKDVFAILKGQSNTLKNASWEQVKEYKFLLENNKLQRFDSKSEFEAFLRQHPTKKQTQKALVADEPAPAALSIPDDACHYDRDELRVLTVREMARIQSFPDNFVFRSKVTTGGQMRKFEVPQYTQVGNAVPPLLGLALGLVLKSLLPER